MRGSVDLRERLHHLGARDGLERADDPLAEEQGRCPSVAAPTLSFAARATANKAVLQRTQQHGHPHGAHPQLVAPSGPPRHGNQLLGPPQRQGHLRHSPAQPGSTWGTSSGWRASSAPGAAESGPRLNPRGSVGGGGPGGGHGQTRQGGKQRGAAPVMMPPPQPPPAATLPQSRAATPVPAAATEPPDGARPNPPLSVKSHRSRNRSRTRHRSRRHRDRSSSSSSTPSRRRRRRRRHGGYHPLFLIQPPEVMGGQF